jgi:hypothetical protein
MLYICLLLAAVTPSILFGADASSTTKIDGFSIIKITDDKYDQLIIPSAISRMPYLFAAYETFTREIKKQKKEKIRVVVREKFHMDWGVATEKKDITWEVGLDNGTFRAWAIYYIVANNKWSGDKKGGYIETIEIKSDDINTMGCFHMRKKFITHICDELKKQGCAQINASLSSKDFALEERKTYMYCGFIEKEVGESILVEKQLN